MPHWLALAATLLVALPLSLAQTKPAGSGHWEGTLQLPTRELKMMVDLAQNEKSEWIGDLDIPEQGVADAPLSNVAVKGTSVSFALPGVPGDPTFKGEVSPDGKEIKGEFWQGGESVPVRLKWTAEANVKLPAKSAPIGKEFEGTWEGLITVPSGQQLRIVLKLANAPDGSGTGTLDSPDQGSAGMPISGIVQKGSSLKFELKIAGASYTGELKGADLAGDWTQGGATLPLTFKRPAAKLEQK